MSAYGSYANGYDIAVLLFSLEVIFSEYMAVF